MKTIKQIREDTSLRTVNGQGMNALVEAGLLDHSKAQIVENALDKDSRVMTPVERKTLVSLVESMLSEIAAVAQPKPGTVSKAPKMNPFISDTRLATPSAAQIPQTLVLRRKSLRTFPDDLTVALYYAPAIDKYVSIPFGKDINVSAVNEVSTFVPPPKKPIDSETSSESDDERENRVAQGRNDLTARRETARKFRETEARKPYLNDPKTSGRTGGSGGGSNKSPDSSTPFHTIPKSSGGGGGHDDTPKTSIGKATQAAKDAAPNLTNIGIMALPALASAAYSAAKAYMTRGASLAAGAGKGSGGNVAKSTDTTKDTTPNAKPTTNNFDSKSNRGNIDKYKERKADMLATRNARNLQIQKSVRDRMAKQAYAKNTSKAVNETFILGGKTFKINTDIHERLFEVYGALSKTNQKKMVDLMTEDLNKVLDFVTRN